MTSWLADPLDGLEIEEPGPLTAAAVAEAPGGWLADPLDGLEIEPLPVRAMSWLSAGVRDAANPYHDKTGRFSHAPGGSPKEVKGGGAEPIPGSAEDVFEAGFDKVDADRKQALQDALDGKKSGVLALIEADSAPVANYVSLGYSDMNKALYGREKMTDQIESDIARFDETFQKPNIAVVNEHPIDVMRGVGPTEASMFAEAGPGSEFVVDGYVSTTTQQRVVDNFNAPGSRQLHIRIEPGTPMVAGEKVEHELILPRGMRYRVTGVSGNRIEVTAS